MMSISTYWGLGDWRAPGSKWMRTEHGWRRQFSVVNDGNQKNRGLLTDVKLKRRVRMGSSSTLYHGYTFQEIRESSRYVTLGDALQRLDVRGVLRDNKRLLYVCQVLKGLLTHRLGSLSGTTLNYVIATIETAVQQVLNTRMYIQVVRDLLVVAESSRIESNRWKVFSNSIVQWQHDLEKKIVKQDDSCLTASRTLLDLPDDCLKLIVDQLDSHKDIINLSRSCRRLHLVSDIEGVWKNLCLFQFTRKQIDVTRNSRDCFSWKKLFVDLKRQHKGSCDVGPAVLRFCQECQALYWQAEGHPCSSDGAYSSVVPCEQFLTMF